MDENVKLTKSETLNLNLSRKYLVIWGKSGFDIEGVLEIQYFGLDLVKSCAQHYYSLGYRVETTNTAPKGYGVEPIVPPYSPVPYNPLNPAPNPYYAPYTPWERPPIWANDQASDKPWGTGMTGTLTFIEGSEGSN